MLVSIDAKSGAVTELSHGNQAVEDFDVSKDGKTVVINVSTPTMIDELFVLGKDGSQKQITKHQSASIRGAQSHRAGGLLVHEL